jgi:hypothetical protein
MVDRTCCCALSEWKQNECDGEDYLPKVGKASFWDMLMTIELYSHVRWGIWAMCFTG